MKVASLGASKYYCCHTSDCSDGILALISPLLVYSLWYLTSTINLVCADNISQGLFKWSMVYLMLSDLYDAWSYLLTLYRTCSIVVKYLNGAINDWYFRCYLASYDTHSKEIAPRFCSFVIRLHGLICLHLSTGSCTYFRDNEDNCNRTISYHSKPFSEDLHTARFHRRPV